MKISGALNFEYLTLHTLYYVILTAISSLVGVAQNVKHKKHNWVCNNI